MHLRRCCCLEMRLVSPLALMLWQRLLQRRQLQLMLQRQDCCHRCQLECMPRCAVPSVYGSSSNERVSFPHPCCRLHLWPSRCRCLS